MLKQLQSLTYHYLAAAFAIIIPGDLNAAKQDAKPVLLISIKAIDENRKRINL